MNFIVDYEDIWWQILKENKIDRPLNQSIVESNLPFGMQRQLFPLNIINRQKPPLLQQLQPKNFHVQLGFSMKDPLISEPREGESIIRRLEPKFPSYEPRIKFIPHRVLLDRPIAIQKEHLNSVLAFDPTALILFKEGEDEGCKTHLTSNANGTVSADKHHLGAIMNTGCWLLSAHDVLNYPLIPLTMNNKLRSLKCVEFIVQEYANLDRIGDEIEFVALNRSYTEKHGENEGRKATILMSRIRRKINDQHMKLFVLDPEGLVKFTSEKVLLESNRVLSLHLYKEEIELSEGDVVILMRGSVECRVIFDALKGKSLEADFENELLKAIGSRSNNLSALIVSKVCKMNDFDDAFRGGIRLKHICHLDTKVGEIVKEPRPGTIAGTTRHSVIYRPSYFGALHHDASKINRFRDTINYAIRKVANASNLQSRLEQEGSGGILRRLSDIQYFAYLLSLPNGAVHLGLGGGAKCVIISKNKKKGVRLLEESILRRIDEDLQDSDRILLLSPHFPTGNLRFDEFIACCSEEKLMKDLLLSSQLNVNNNKLSMVLFEIKINAV